MRQLFKYAIPILQLISSAGIVMYLISDARPMLPDWAYFVISSAGILNAFTAATFFRATRRGEPMQDLY